MMGWLVGFGPLFPQEKVPVEYAWEDPTKIKTADTCRQCHTSEYEVWKKSTHARSFKTLHREEAAEAIAKKMGFNLIKRESLCLTCHYTPIIERGTLRAVSGVSCESCHGASAEWLNIHNQYGGKGFTHENETAEHKAERIKTSRELGMLRPSDLYPVASRCFQCHTVPHEGLVNKGGHGTGSSDFELVSWMQGEVRHNFFESFLTGDGTVNADRSPARKRLMYVLGRTLDVEYSIRGIAVAKEKKRYFKAMSRRLRTAIGEVRAILSQAEIETLEDVLSLVRAAKIVPDNETELLHLANQIGETAKRFLSKHDGSRLAKLDPLVAGESIAETYAEPDQIVSISPKPTTPDSPSPLVPSTSDVDAVTQVTTANSSSSSVKKVPAIPATGAKKSHLRPTSSIKTLGPGKCSGCHSHEVQSTWWFDDAHYSAADPFFEEDPQYLKIARLYELNSTNLTRGRTICMDCHATVVSGKENREVNDGVSCESCHGPAGDYLEPHQDGEASEGLQRKGYLAAIKLGMVAKNDAKKRAESCASCHYITDERLLSAGHESGKDFDYLKGLAAIKHWETSTVEASALKAGYAGALTARGAVPEVRLAREAMVSAKKPTKAGSSKKGRPIANLLRDPENKKVARPQVPKPRPVSPVSIRKPIEIKSLALPPFPEIDESMPLEEVLLRLKQRLELLYQRVYSQTEEKQ